MQHVDKSVGLFRQGYNCSQAVFAAFADCCGLDEKQALALAAPFGAGLGKMREVCGAFSGLAMVCGAIRGDDQTTPAEREKIYALVQQLAAEFKEEFGTLICRELLGLDQEQEFGNGSARPSERTPAYYKERPCARCVEFCARLGEQVV